MHVYLHTFDVHMYIAGTHQPLLDTCVYVREPLKNNQVLVDGRHVIILEDMNVLNRCP